MGTGITVLNIKESMGGGAAGVLKPEVYGPAAGMYDSAIITGALLNGDSKTNKGDTSGIVWSKTPALWGEVHVVM